MTTSAPPAAETPRHHGRLLVVIWVVSSLIAVPLVIWVLGPHLPPGDFSSEASDQTSANIVLTAVCAPILLGVVIYFLYAVFTFRQRGETIEDGAPIKGHAATQTAWIVGTSVLVLALAIWGSLVLVVSANGAGGGQGPSPVNPPSGEKLQVQVIGQQWNWTYRYPAYGGVETQNLYLPEHTYVELHVTSLDVIHSFWAYKLGVKADANPGVDNIAYVDTRGPMSFEIRCAELCGLWHGYMYQTGHIVPQSQFAAWIKQQQTLDSSVARYLPKYARFYYPDPQRRGG